MATDRPGQNFGLAFGKALRSRGKTKADVARGIGVSETHLGDMERGERRPSVDLIDKIADALRLEQWEREVLHRAGAVDQGYRIGASA